MGNTTLDDREQKIEIVRSTICGERSICCQPNGEYLQYLAPVVIGDAAENANKDIDYDAIQAKFEGNVGRCGSFANIIVIGGQNTNLHEFPWTVQIYYKQ